MFVYNPLLERLLSKAKSFVCPSDYLCRARALIALLLMGNQEVIVEPLEQ